MKTATSYTWLTLLLIILFSGNLIAQQSERNKLRIQISKETNDTSRIKLLIQLGLYYPENDSEQNKCFREIYDLSKKNKFYYGLAYCQYREVLHLWGIGRYDEAIDKCKRCIEVFDALHKIDEGPLVNICLLFNLAGKQEERFKYYTEKVAYYKRHGPTENIAVCYHGIAGYYSHLAEYDKSIEYYYRARESYKSFNPVSCANEMQCIGWVYLEWGNLMKAEECLKSALKDLIRLKANCFFSYHQLGDLCFKRQDYNGALQYYFKGKEYCISPELKAITLVNCAAVHLQLDSKDSALFYLESAERIRQKENLGLFFANGNLEIDYNFYKYYVAIGQDRRAKKSLEAALREAKLSRYLPIVLKYTNELHSYLLKIGDSIQSLRYLVQYQSIQDSLNAKNTRAKIASFEIEQQQQQKENKIEQLQAQKTKQRNYYLIGGALLLLIVIGLITSLRYKRRRDKEQLTTDFKKQLAQAETKALRAQMNPHFIFNSLNSINSFVMDQKHEIASDYLIKFSKLIRLILDNSRSETISIEKELETLKLYVLLESARFDNKFKCIYQIAEDVNTDSIMIPPMLLQPFVENAIWHGLMQKEGEGMITVEIKKENEEFLNISITDNGIGREKASEIKSKSATHKSHGLKVTSQRIEMMNKLNSTGAQVHVIDLKDDQGHATGTKVELIIPF
jgi:tetratricopeptide (TPR) repeat protein